MMRLSKKIFRLFLSCLTVIAVLLCTFNYSVSSSPTPRFKFKAKITGSICEVYGTSPTKQKDKKCSILILTENPKDLTTITPDSIAWIEQFTTGKSGSFYLTFKLINSRVNYENGNTKAYIYMNQEDCNVSNVLEVDILPVSGTVDDISSVSVRVGIDVYECNSPLLNEDNILDSIKRGGNELWFKLGNNWYDILNDKCTDSTYLQSKNSIPKSEVNNRMWGRYYKNGEVSPVYFK